MSDLLEIPGLKFEKKIAVGGMGTVYRAKTLGAEGFEKIVAIKTLLKELTENDDFKTMFIEEAKLVANLVHENIVQIYQLGKYDDMLYFILEYVDGMSIFDMLRLLNKKKQILTNELAIFIVSRIARGLAYAHSRTDEKGEALNIAHCDICPHNVLISTEGIIKITDFGVSRAGSKGDYAEFTGKVGYMSPEQAKREKVDYRTDIYSLGIILFNMLTGAPIRNLELETHGNYVQAREGFVDWSKLSENTDSDLVAILKKSLALDPEDRYQSIADMAGELEYYIYRGGYGPTIVTMANYLKKHFSFLYSKGDDKVEEERELLDSSGVLDGPGVELNKTIVVMPKQKR